MNELNKLSEQMRAFCVSANGLSKSINQAYFAFLAFTDRKTPQEWANHHNKKAGQSNRINRPKFYDRFY